MRIAVGRLIHETSAFSPVLTTLADFQARGILLGAEIFEKGLAGRELEGFVQVARAEENVELIPTLSAWAMPAGTVTSEAHQFLKSKLLEELRKAGELDGILLSLHGAMSAEDAYDVEGELLETIRTEWGERIPIVITLDHHANITKRLVETANALAGYHTEPHLDALETGFKAAKILFATVRGEIKPTVRWRKIPMIAAGNLLAPAGPLGRFFEEAEAFEKMDRVLAVSIFPEFPYADSPELGWSVVAVTDDAPELAQSIADQLAQGLWEQRHLFLPAAWPSPREAVRQALEIDGGPIVLSDYGDMTTGGAPGDSTAILRELLDKDLGGKALLTLVDPEAVETSIAVGVGEQVTVAVGGKIGRVHSQPVMVTGRVRLITEDTNALFLKPATATDTKRVVVLEVDDIYIVLSEVPGPNLDPALYRSVGLEPGEAKIVVVKSGYSFRAAYEPIAKAIIIVDSPGVSSPNLQSLSSLYQLAPRPLFPLDEDATF